MWARQHLEDQITLLKIVEDPVTRQLESINPDLFYTLLSRATTFGEEKKPETSAIFFKGQTSILRG